MAQKIVEGARLSANGLAVGGRLVKFVQDVFPHVVGDVKRVAKEELARVDKKAEQMGLKGAVYEDVAKEDIKKAEDAAKADAEQAKNAIEGK